VIPFHKLLIATAIVFCAGMGVWAGLEYRTAGSSVALVLAVGCFAAAAALGYYLRHLKRFLGR
jgi:quinol-cytochrome oxidoreductase complex cytochrome b subunit